jgi:hypothetical protein
MSPDKKPSRATIFVVPAFLIFACLGTCYLTRAGMVQSERDKHFAEITNACNGTPLLTAAFRTVNSDVLTDFGLKSEKEQVVYTCLCSPNETFSKTATEQGGFTFFDTQGNIAARVSKRHPIYALIISEEQKNQYCQNK